MEKLRTFLKGKTVENVRLKNFLTHSMISKYKRFCGFFDDEQIFVLTNGFTKKSRKTPGKEITLAEQRKKGYVERL